MPRTEFVFFDAGGGHRAAATALKDVMEQQNGYWDVRLLNLREVLGSLDIFRKWTGIELEEIYNRMLANGWTLGSPYLLPGIHALIRLYEGPQVRLLSQYWTKHPCDMVVSVVPNFNRGLFKGLKRANSSTPYVTILTDFADYPPHFWIERQDQYLICGTDQAVKQAMRMGFDRRRVYRTSGMILRPAFYVDYKHDRKTELTRMGLDPNLRTGVVLFGGMGSPQMRRITELLEPLHDQLQLVLICGRNRKLADRLRSISGRLRKHIVEFTTEVPFYMSLGDFFIGKPGPGSISEALAMNLPVIIERNARTLPQERYNADWVRQTEVGIVVRSFRHIADAARELLAPDTFQRLKANAKAVQNRAVFEIPPILNEIVTKS